LSNLSVFVAMLMALSGAQQQTRLEIIKSLKIESFFGLLTENSNFDTIKLQNLNSLVKKLLQDITNNQDQNQLVIANKVIIKNLQVNTSFKETIETVFDAKIGYFEPSIIEETNKWISSLTNKKIEKILTPDFLKTDSCLALINVIYFKYDWMHQFDERLTEKEDFMISSNQIPLRVDMMQLAGKQLPYHYSEALNSHLIRLPYEKQKFSLNIIFPSSDNDFLLKSDDSSLINKINYHLLKTEMDNLSLNSINLSMPKFKINKKINV
jgi:serine protease inhibitor